MDLITQQEVLPFITLVIVPFVVFLAIKFDLHKGGNATRVTQKH